MATLSLSPTPVPITAMSMPSRRVPLSSNPNVANSPLRGASTLASYAKQKRSHATAQREEPYGQQPPVKKQAVENASRRPRSPSKIARPQSQLISQRGTTRPATKDRAARAVVARPDHDAESDKEVWKKHHRAKFPKMVFYFESIPDEVRTKLTKRVLFLGAVRAAPRQAQTCVLTLFLFSVKNPSSRLM